MLCRMRYSLYHNVDIIQLPVCQCLISGVAAVVALKSEKDLESLSKCSLYLEKESHDIDTYTCTTHSYEHTQIHTWSDHYFVFVGSDSEKGQVIGWVQISHSASCLGCQLLDLTGVLDCSGIVQGGADRNTWGKSRYFFLINAHLFCLMFWVFFFPYDHNYCLMLPSWFTMMTPVTPL